MLTLPTRVPLLLGGKVDPVQYIEQTLGGIVIADYNAQRNVRAVSGVVGVHDDARCVTPDGQIYIPVVNGEGVVCGNTTGFNALTAMTIMVELASDTAVVAPDIMTRGSGATATTRQFEFARSSNDFYVRMGNGTTVSEFTTTGSALNDNGRFRLFLRYDASQATDATKVTFWLSTFDAVAQTWSVVSQKATTVSSAGAPAQLLTVTANLKLGQRNDAALNPLGGVMGGNGTSIRVWDSALTEAQMNTELGSATPVIAAKIAYDFSGATPYANRGSWGAAGDGTPGSGTVLCSGDRRYCGLGSLGTSRPVVVAGAGGPQIVADGVNDFLRAIWRGKLESITADMMILWCGKPPTVDGNNRILVNPSNSNSNALWLQVYSAGGIKAATITSAGGGIGAAGVPSGIRVISTRRSASGSGTTGYREGVNTEVTVMETPETALAVNRFTVFASNAGTPSRWADGSYARIVLVRGLTDANKIAQAQAHFARFCQRVYGAQVSG